MSTHTLTTLAIVCGHEARQGADAIYWLFTEELGMVVATARSVREERSKQRFALQDFSLINISLIQGKVQWRIGSVESLTNYFLDSENRDVRGSVCLVVRSLRRYLQGEGTTPGLFAEIKTQLETLIDPNLPNRSQVEGLIQVRTLEYLGYLSTTYRQRPLAESLDSLAIQPVSSFNHLITTGREASHL